MTKWYTIHKALTEKLLFFLDQERADKVGLYLVDLFLNKRSQYETEFSWFFKSYDIVQRKLTTNEWAGAPHLDPIQIFSSINNKSSKKVNRLKRIRALFDVLEIKFAFDDIDFEGCPTPVVVQAIQFKSSQDAIILWRYFEKISVNQKVKQKDFKGGLVVYGVEATLLSIFTFWVSPFNYIPLDKWTISYLVNEKKTLSVEESLHRSESLFEILNDDIKLHTNDETDTVELVKNAYEWQIKGEGMLKGSFKLLAVRTLESNDSLFKILASNTYYILDHGFQVKDSGVYYMPSLVNVFSPAYIGMVNANTINVNINAIVGKNGSGKSTLIELIYLLLYNLSHQQGFITEDRHGRILHPIGNINFEIYFELTNIYRLSCVTLQGKAKVLLSESKFSDNGPLEFREMPLGSNIYNSIFYTIAVNYSLYSLNSLEYTNIHKKPFDWLSALTHKNDGYHTPIVITPLREDGNINVNLEKHLTKQRLLINFLQIHEEDLPDNLSVDKGNDESKRGINSIRSLDNGKTITHIKILQETAKVAKYRSNLELNHRQRAGILNRFQSQYKEEKQQNAKNRSLKNDLEYLSKEEVNRHFDSIAKHYNIIHEVDCAYKLYIVIKLFKICQQYNGYHKYRSIFQNIINGKLSEFDSLLKKIDLDNSHVTDKYKQVINFLKSDSLRALYQVDKRLLLDDINREITLILGQGKRGLVYPHKILNNKKIVVEYQHLIVPPIFEYEYYIGEIKADRLSSGEQQLLNTFSNILYHLKNLESKHKANIKNIGVQYRFVNIVLDEIELYFHPEYQRKYIFRLFKYLTNPLLDLNNIQGINILFCTHSPFILSDIPSQKILMIKDGKVADNNNGVNSFAANIHDLLKDEFFMEGGAMGEFSKTYVNQLTKELGESLNDNIDMEEVEVQRRSLKYRIDTIGEPLIRNTLLSMWHEKFNKEKLPSYEELVKFYRQNKIKP